MLSLSKTLNAWLCVYIHTARKGADGRDKKRRRATAPAAVATTTAVMMLNYDYFIQILFISDLVRFVIPPFLFFFYCCCCCRAAWIWYVGWGEERRESLFALLASDGLACVERRKMWAADCRSHHHPSHRCVCAFVWQSSSSSSHSSRMPIQSSSSTAATDATTSSIYKTQPVASSRRSINAARSWLLYFCVCLFCWPFFLKEKETDRCLLRALHRAGWAFHSRQK